MSKVIEWVDSRTGISELLDDEVFSKKAPRLAKWYEFFGCFGGMSLILFIVQVLTGTFLLIYYTPSPTGCFLQRRLHRQRRLFRMALQATARGRRECNDPPGDDTHAQGYNHRGVQGPKGVPLDIRFRSPDAHDDDGHLRLSPALDTALVLGGHRAHDLVLGRTRYRADNDEGDTWRGRRLRADPGQVLRPAPGAPGGNVALHGFPFYDDKKVWHPGAVIRRGWENEIQQRQLEGRA